MANISVERIQMSDTEEKFMLFVDNKIVKAVVYNKKTKEFTPVNL
jgi:hypothetical protein